MGQKVTFDELTYTIWVTLPPDADGIVFIDVKEDIYSDGKEDWVNTESLRKFKFPVSAVGGNPLPGSKSLGSTFFLDSKWKVAPYEANHRCIVNGNFYSVDGTSPFQPTAGAYNVFLEQQVSSLVDSTVQQLTEIEYASYNGGVSLDALFGSTGVEYNVGTIENPSSNWTDARQIAVSRGFDKYYVSGTYNFLDTDDISGFVFEGKSPTKTSVNIPAAAVSDDAEFYFMHVHGTLDGGSLLSRCLVTGLNYFNGFIEQCMLGLGDIVLGGGVQADLLDCWSGVAGTGTPTIDMGGSGQSMTMRNYAGGILLKNKTGPESVSVDLNSGQCILDSTVTNGTIVCRGDGKLIDTLGEHIESGTWNGATIVNETVNRDVVGLSQTEATQLAEIHQIRGLDSANPVSIADNGTTTTLTVGNLTIDITDTSIVRR